MTEALMHIGELSRRTGLSVDRIRAWERRYDLLQPGRTDGGFRLYSVDDISRLRLMQHYISRGIPAAQAAGMVHRAQTAAFDANPGVPEESVREALAVLRDSLERFDDAPADRLLERFTRLFAPGAVLRDVVLPYLKELGDRWACGEATIAQEHFASCFLEGWMLTMARGWSRPGRRRAVLACVPGERHTLGLIAFGLALRELGWRITYMGADVPVTAIDQAAGAVKADTIVLACSLGTTLAVAAPALTELSDRYALAMGGSGCASGDLPLLTGRALPQDPLVAAHALTEHRASAEPEPESVP